ncbi:TATA box-binding protein-associated factor RNA polymerase I subunit B [Frankliniella fusca]|uniref:TATA box-binding protein-associated factor RNA polymerase I subunit B n=1 Tax=Frankliniella fusca TaxID=407009 RepID=A0AAE1LCW9_9NEOP|nr:TATA box-binding protein-associated factor RNA polymerase I subunit B [Frankliniella fusca]
MPTTICSWKKEPSVPRTEASATSDTYMPAETDTTPTASPASRRPTRRQATESLASMKPQAASSGTDMSSRYLHVILLSRAAGPGWRRRREEGVQGVVWCDKDRGMYSGTTLNQSAELSRVHDCRAPV